VSIADLKEFGFPHNFSKLRLAELLEVRYPEHRWEKVYLLRGKYAQQTRLENAVRALFTVSYSPLYIKLP